MDRPRLAAALAREFDRSGRRPKTPVRRGRCGCRRKRETWERWGSLLAESIDAHYDALMTRTKKEGLERGLAQERALLSRRAAHRETSSGPG